MKIKCFDKHQKIVTTLYSEILTAEKAREIADPALEEKTNRIANILIDCILNSIGDACAQARYNFSCSPYSIYSKFLEGEEPVTTKQERIVNDIIIEKLRSYGYLVSSYLVGEKTRVIEISWEYEI